MSITNMEINKTDDKNLLQVNFLDLKLLTGSFNNATDWIIEDIMNASVDSLKIIFHINVLNFYNLRSSKLIQDKIASKSTLLFDGIGMKVGAYILGMKWLPDLNGTDLFPMVMKKAQLSGIKIYFVGASNESIKKAVNHCREKYPGIKIVGYYNGYFEKNEEKKVVQSIKNSGAQLLMVGRGGIDYSDFIIDNRNKFGVCLIWNVGGLFDFISGNKPRAPLWLRKCKLEWLFRFIIEPKRMWERNFIIAPWFIFYISYMRLQRIFKNEL